MLSTFRLLGSSILGDFHFHLPDLILALIRQIQGKNPYSHDCPDEKIKFHPFSTSAHIAPRLDIPRPSCDLEFMRSFKWCVLFLLCCLAGCWRRTPSGQSFVTAASIQAAITSDFDAQVKAIGGAGDNWKIITDPQYDALILRLSKNRELSGPSGWKPGMPLLDAWGHRFHVAFKRADVVVWSNGPDGIENTSDDVISPHEFNGKLP